MEVIQDTNLLAENLRVLCAKEKSIAEVCRRLKINRQQFSRYLSGETRPSANNLMRICAYFEVSPDHLDRPLNTVEVAKRAGFASISKARGQIEKPFLETDRRINQYLGDYLVYRIPQGVPGYCHAMFLRMHHRSYVQIGRAS